MAPQQNAIQRAASREKLGAIFCGDYFFDQVVHLRIAHTDQFRLPFWLALAAQQKSRSSLPGERLCAKTCINHIEIGIVVSFDTARCPLRDNSP